MSENETELTTGPEEQAPGPGPANDNVADPKANTSKSKAKNKSWGEKFYQAVMDAGQKKAETAAEKETSPMHKEAERFKALMIKFALFSDQMYSKLWNAIGDCLKIDNNAELPGQRARRDYLEGLEKRRNNALAEERAQETELGNQEGIQMTPMSRVAGVLPNNEQEEEDLDNDDDDDDDNTLGMG